MTNLNTIGRYWKDKYGEKVYKIPISITGFTCPNIDGTVAKGGCTFCENDSFAPNLQKDKKSDFKLHPDNKVFVKTQFSEKLNNWLEELTPKRVLTIKRIVGESVKMVEIKEQGSGK